MPPPGDVVTRYHRILEQNGFDKSGWAEELQQRMRQHRLTDSGRLLSPVLRPFFVTQKQLDSLTKVASQLSAILDKLAVMILSQPALLNRLVMLPAEKSLFTVDPGYQPFSVAGSFDASMSGTGCLISGIDASVSLGLGYANGLADLFLDLPAIKEFRRNGQKVTKLPARKVAQSLMSAWQQFGGNGKPNVAVVDWAHANEGGSDGELLAELLAAQGMLTRFASPEKLVLEDGVLKSAGQKIDLVVRRISTRDLVTRWDLSHPLLQAYRAHAVCVVNSFRAEFAQRRAFLELLTDEKVIAGLTSNEKKLLRSSVRWTRVMSARRVQFEDQEIDLLDWVVKNRERLLLIPDQPGTEARTYAGSEMTSVAWEWAVRQSLRSPYVVQDCKPQSREVFPFFQYGELKLRQVDVTLRAQVLGSELGDCTAVLHARSAGGVTPLGIAPVLLAE